MTTAPLTPERLREIASLCTEIDGHAYEVLIPELLAEIARLSDHSGILEFQRDAFHDQLTALRADLAETNLVLEQQDRDLEKLRSDLDHATAHDGDHLSKASRRMVDTVMGDRDALRLEVARLKAQRADDVNVWHATESDLAHNRRRADEAERELTLARSRITALESGLREACNWIADRSPDGSILVDRLRALANNTTKETT